MITPLQKRQKRISCATDLQRTWFSQNLHRCS